MSSRRSLRTPEAYPVTTRADIAVAKRAAGQWSVLSLDELRECGLNKTAVGVRVRRGNLHPFHRGVYAVGHRNVPQEGRWLAAVKACGPGTVLSHFSAAALHDLVKWDGRPIEVTAPSRHRMPGIKAHRSERIERTVVKGIPVTPKLRTVIDLAKVADERTVKRALRAAKFAAAELERLPKRILDLGAVLTRSPLEDRVYDFVVSSPLERPQANPPYRLPNRTVYPDLYWPHVRLIVEVDSYEWHDDPLARLDDARRQAELERRASGCSE
jgi:predicted transcriptional regulator of viral defense system